MFSRFFKRRFQRQLQQQQRQVEDYTQQAEQGIDRYVFKRFTRLLAVKRFVATWVGLLVLLIIGILLQNFTLNNYYQVTEPIAGGTYREGILGTFTTANPLYATSDVDTAVSHLLFSGLLKYNESNQLSGDLASGYLIDAKGTTYTLKLRPNLIWQDGKPLTSADVLFTYQAIQNPDAKSPLLSGWQGIAVSAPDPQTVVFKLPTVLASFPQNLTNGIVPRHLLTSVPVSDLRTADFNTVSPVGSGPFAWRAIQVTGSDPASAEEQVAMVPFASYYGGRPKLDQFVVHAYANHTAMERAFSNNELNGLSGITEVPSAFQKQSDVQVHNLLLTAGVYTFFKTTNSVLSDQIVRQALVAAADPQAIIQTLGYPTRPVQSPLLRGQLGYDASLLQPKSDQALAEKLLTDDGWLPAANGHRQKAKQELTFNLVVADTREYHQVADQLQKQWRAIGIEPVIRFLASQDFQSAIAYHDYDAVLYGISIGTDPDVFVYWDSSQADVRSANRLNLSEYKNATADTALEAGRTRLNPDLRIIKYKPFLQAWQQNAPALGLYQPRVLYVTHGTVAGLHDRTVNTATDRYSNVVNWEIRHAKVTQ